MEEGRGKGGGGERSVGVGGERKNAAVQRCSAAGRLSETRDVRTCGRMDESGRTDGLTLHECADAGATACVTRPTKSKRETSHSHIACCQSQRPRASRLPRESSNFLSCRLPPPPVPLTASSAATSASSVPARRHPTRIQSA